MSTEQNRQSVIDVERVGFTIRDQVILSDVSLTVRYGEFVGVIGPNGSGKSTLLKSIYRVHTPTSGQIRIRGRLQSQMTNRQAARALAVVSQETQVNFDFSVTEVVAMGRYPQKRMLDTLNQNDEGIIADALAAVEMETFSERSFLSLSGGEKQRVLIARALAQQTDIIILDEPTNHLDLGSQLSAMKLIRSTGKTVLAALHDLSIAAHYCDRIYALQKGRVLCSGAPRDVITAELVQRLYGVHAEVFDHNEKLFLDYN